MQKNAIKLEQLVTWPASTKRVSYLGVLDLVISYVWNSRLGDLGRRGSKKQKGIRGIRASSGPS